MRFKESKSANILVKEASEREDETLSELNGKVPEYLKSIFTKFNVFSNYFEKRILSEWVSDEKFDELVDYCIYQYQDNDSRTLLNELIFELQRKKKEELGNKLLDALYVNRAAYFWVQLKNYKKHPDNLHCATSFHVAKGKVMYILNEHLMLLENKPESEQDEAKVLEVRMRVQEILNEKKARKQQS